MNFDIAIYKSEGSVMYVSSIAVMNGTKILMGVRRDSKKWTLPGGGVDPKEDRAEGAIRELFEEAGIKTDKSKLTHLRTQTVSGNAGVKITVAAYKYEWDGQTATSKNDPDEEVAKWEWIETKGGLPEHVRNNLNSPKNVVLQAMGLIHDETKQEKPHKYKRKYKGPKGEMIYIYKGEDKVVYDKKEIEKVIDEDEIEEQKGGVGSGQRGHHTADSHAEAVHEQMRQPDTETAWDESVERKRSIFYVSPESKNEQSATEENIRRKEEESWKRMMAEAMKMKSAKKSFALVIDLLKSTGTHKYLRKYKRGAKWIYVYYEPGNKPKRMEDRAMEILTRMAELGDERAKKILESVEEHPEHVLTALRIEARGTGAHARDAKKMLAEDYGIDHDEEQLEERLMPGVVAPPSDKIHQEMTPEQKEHLKEALNIHLKKMFDHLESSSYRTDVHAVKMREAGITKEVLTDGVLDKPNMAEAFKQLHENLKKLDVAHTGLNSSAGMNEQHQKSYPNMLFNESLKHMENKGHLTAGYTDAHKRTRENAPTNHELTPVAALQERLEQQAREKREREAAAALAAKQLAAQQRRERAERERIEAARLEVENREVLTTHGETADKMMEYFGIRTTSEAEKTKMKANLCKGIQRVFGTTFKWDKFESSLNPNPTAKTKVKVKKNFLDGLINFGQSGSTSGTFEARFDIMANDTGEYITYADRKITKNPDGSISWYNGYFNRPENDMLERYNGMGKGLYGGVERFLKDLTSTWTGTAKENTRIHMSAANHGWGDGLKGALVWSKHYYDFANPDEYVGNWKSTWKSNFKRMADRLSLPEEQQAEVRARIDSCRYPNDFVRLGVIVDKATGLKALDKRAFDFDFNKVFASKGHCDIGELILIDSTSSFSGMNYINKTDARWGTLNERRTHYYNTNNNLVEPAQISLTSGRRPKPTSTPTPAQTSPATSATSPPGILNQSNPHAQDAINMADRWRRSSRGGTLTVGPARLKKMITLWPSLRLDAFLIHTGLSAAQQRRITKVRKQYVLHLAGRAENPFA